ncbi:MAG: FAD-dependent oxidoreductase [Limnobacter sp.]|nr:FAD-dependent oxidoreductase [Limnobacter sp.]
MTTTLIIGSGVAAWTLARELRKASPEQRLIMVTQDSGDFYSKPMLSNALASGKNPENLVMTPAARLADMQKVELHTHTRVLAIQPAAKTVQVCPHTQAEHSAHATLPYDHLVIATGADPTRLPMQGTGAAHVLSVNDLTDYAAFRQTLTGKHTVAVLGAGLIGCEFANDLLKANLVPVVFDVAHRALARLLPQEASVFLENRLSQAGVRWKLGTTITHIDKTSQGYLLTDAQGATTPADLVLSAVGLTPRTKLAQQAGLHCERGLVTDKFGCTSNPHIYALGDCAQYHGQHVLPYIMPIMQAARALAKTLSGQPTPIHFPAMPVTVKTPDCPTVVCPPQPDLAGTWETEATESGVKSLFKTHTGELLGMALLGDAVQERQTLAALLPPLQPTTEN